MLPIHLKIAAFCYSIQDYLNKNFTSFVVTNSTGTDYTCSYFTQNYEKNEKSNSENIKTLITSQSLDTSKNFITLTKDYHKLKNSNS